MTVTCSSQSARVPCGRDPKEVEERSRCFAKELVAKLVDVVGAVKHVEAGCNVEEVARETGLPERTIRAWRVKLSGSGAGTG